MNQIFSSKHYYSIFTDDFGDATVEHRSTIIDPLKANNSIYSHKYLQTIYVVDQYLREELGQATLEKLLPTLANIVRLGANISGG